MLISSITIHNFRSLQEATINLGNYSLLIGPNNAGKSNVIDAIRCFYENNEKYIQERDFPKCCTQDNDSWVEMSFDLTEEEYSSLEPENNREKNKICIRKVFEDKLLKPGYYEIIGDSIPLKNFPRKFGKCIYIPAVSTLETQTKMSGPSPLRELVNDVFLKVVHSSKSFNNLQSEIVNFGTKIKKELTEDDKSLEFIENSISNEIANWNLSFNFKFNPLNDVDLVKNILDYQIIDENLASGTDAQRQGQGFQRQLIYTLIRLSANYFEKTKSSQKKEFSPNFTILLFEEPEAFLHPSQQDTLSKNLKSIAQQEGSQVIISTHSPIFVSHNSLDIPSLICLSRKGNQTNIGQILQDQLIDLFEENQEINKLLVGTKFEPDEEEFTQDMELLRYFMLLHPERSQSFFSSHVILVEGATERYLLNFMFEKDLLPNSDSDLFVFECMGKFNIPRFMNLFGKLKIYHSVIYDRDNSKYPQKLVNELIDKQKNLYTKKIIGFPSDIEDYLGVDKRKDKKGKPQHLLLKFYEGKIDQSKIDKLVQNLSEISKA